jgi:tRNA-splicing ligase RtcB
MPAARIQSPNVPVLTWAPPSELEPDAIAQLKNIASLPWCFSHVAAMPDVHLGKGATVGSVVAMNGAVSPAAVGVDIGCGMAAVRTTLGAAALPDDLKPIRRAVERAIPMGFHEHRDPLGRALSPPLAREIDALLGEFSQLATEVRDLDQKAARQLGSLGGGNHFIELCLDSQERVWLMLHSGSRNIGNRLAELHIARARKLAHNRALPDPDLAVFLAGTREMEAYRRDLFWAQRYARLNRAAMLELYFAALQNFFPSLGAVETIQCHHNYVAEETHEGVDVLVTRKGAIRAGRGELGIIPGSMGTRSYIVRGLGNPLAFESASHGAGRRMSRHAARRKFSVADLAQQTAGVECRKDPGVLDEIPGAYKDIDRVMEEQRDLVEVVEVLRQVMCCKG